MGLVGYSDSEGSSDEEAKPAQHVRTTAPAKPALIKAVDSSNPRKIRVNLPEPIRGPSADSADADEPPAKRARTAVGGPSGFNALLPAPKGPAGAAPGGLTKARGLGRGVSLKTGATPGFSREPMPIPQPEQEQDERQADEDGDVIASAGSTAPTTAPEPAKKGNAMMFKPLSVARKPQKKKKPKPAAGAAEAANPSLSSTESIHPPKAPKVSLFSMSAPDTSESQPPNPFPGEYQPTLYKASPTSTDALLLSDFVPQPAQSRTTPSNDTQSLNTIASDLDLSASARRQLFGRGGQGASAVNVANFNTDAEWAANEELRAAGEQATHNPVRAIATGKHSLKQLVNAVSTQKDALEEQFATGRRNRKEAGTRYGW